LHLKIVAYHDDRLCEGATLPLELLELKQVLMPRQWFLKKLDPKGELSVPELLDLLRQHMLAYRADPSSEHSYRRYGRAQAAQARRGARV
jgi:hypothetical protein